MQLKGLLMLATAVTFASADITRDEIMRRAEFWVAKHIPYSMNAYAPDPQGTRYRTDCSGFVSMAVKAGTSLSTVTLPSISHPIGWEDLLPGDLVGTLGPGTGGASGHVTLFKSWVDASHTAYHTLECKGDAGCVAYQRKKGWTDGPFTAKPYRYNHVANPPPPPPKKTSTVLMHSTTATKSKPVEAKSSTTSKQTKVTPTVTTSASAGSTTAHHNNNTSTRSTLLTKTTTPYSNNTSTTSSSPLVTSIVFTTTVRTITSCHTTVTNCPAHSTVLITETIPAYTTVCPATDKSVSPTGSRNEISAAPIVSTGVLPSSSVGAVVTTAPVVAGANKLTCACAAVLGTFAAIVL